MPIFGTVSSINSPYVLDFSICTILCFCSIIILLDKHTQKSLILDTVRLSFFKKVHGKSHLHELFAVKLPLYLTYSPLMIFNFSLVKRALYACATSPNRRLRCQSIFEFMSVKWAIGS